MSRSPSTSGALWPNPEKFSPINSRLSAKHLRDLSDSNILAHLVEIATRWDDCGVDTGSGPRTDRRLRVWTERYNLYEEEAIRRGLL